MRPPLATTAAEGNRSSPGAAPLKFQCRMQRQPCTRCADRVAQRDGTAIDVDDGRVDAKVPRRLQRHGGKSLVDLDEVEGFDAETLPREGRQDGLGTTSARPPMPPSPSIRSWS